MTLQYVYKSQDAQAQKELLAGRKKVGVGVYDGLSALIASKYRFDFLWVSSFAISASHGLPDAGLLDATDVLSIVRMAMRASQLPIVVDLDAGYGDPIKLFHVVKSMAEAGVSAVCIEDNSLSKRCSLYNGYQRPLASIEEHVARIRACIYAVNEARRACAVIARTEALVAGKGVDEALMRASAYIVEGADAIFAQSIDPTGADILRFCSSLKYQAPIFLAPTRFPQILKQTLFDAGATHVIFANQGIRAAHHAMCEVFSRLEESECSNLIEPDISSVADISMLVGEQHIKDLDATLATSFIREARTLPNSTPFQV